MPLCQLHLRRLRGRPAQPRHSIAGRILGDAACNGYRSLDTNSCTHYATAATAGRNAASLGPALAATATDAATHAKPTTEPAAPTLVPGKPIAV